MQNEEERLDYYRVLGVARDASIDEIKKQYKKLALEHHPDKNLDRKEAAAIEFNKIAEANEVLSDPEKRKDYDAADKGGYAATYEGIFQTSTPKASSGDKTKYYFIIPEVDITGFKRKNAIDLEALSDEQVSEMLKNAEQAVRRTVQPEPLTNLLHIPALLKSLNTAFQRMPKIQLFDNEADVYTFLDNWEFQKQTTLFNTAWVIASVYLGKSEVKVNKAKHFDADEYFISSSHSRHIDIDSTQFKGKVYQYLQPKLVDISDLDSIRLFNLSFHYDPLAIYTAPPRPSLSIAAGAHEAIGPSAELLADIKLLVDRKDLPINIGLNQMKPILNNNKLTDEEKIQKIAKLAQDRVIQNPIAKSIMSVFRTEKMDWIYTTLAKIASDPTTAAGELRQRLIDDGVKLGSEPKSLEDTEKAAIEAAPEEKSEKGPGA